jgi:hypothetical protein
MFDLLLRNSSGEGVPVPLPGRGLLFVGSDGVMRVKLSNGAVIIPTGGASPTVAPTGAPTTAPTGAPVIVEVMGPTFNKKNGFRATTLDGALQIALGSMGKVTGDLNISIGAAATVLDLSELVEVTGAFIPNTMAALTSLKVHKLKKTGIFRPEVMAGLTWLDLPELETTSHFAFNTMAALVTVNVPKFKTTGLVDLWQLAALTELNFDALVTASMGFRVAVAAALVAVRLPLIEHLGTNNLFYSISLDNGTVAMTTLDIGPNLKRVDGAVTLTSCALDQTSVNNTIIRLAALDGTNGTTIYQGKQVTITGTTFAPTGDGLTAKQTLQARGCTVTTL